MKDNFFIIAGDPSGDIHAARLMAEIKKLQDVNFIGIGGKRMIAEGLESLADLRDVSVVGFWEVMKKYGFFSDLLKKSKDLISSSNVKAFIPVDYPGFNIRLASFAKKQGTPVIYYIAPQLWAWGSNRAKKLKGAVDKLLVVFPFETEYFQKFDLNAEYVGHPLLDDPVIPDVFPDYEERERMVALMPGSRTQEVQKHLPLLEAVFKLLKKELPELKAGIAKSSAVDDAVYERSLSDNKDWEIIEDSKELMKQSLTGVVKTGTSTLEAALCGMPFSMYYLTSFITYQMGKSLINLPYISLVNILLNRPLIREFVQKDAKPENIARDVFKYINDKELYNIMQEQFRELRQLLGGRGASERAAKIFMDSVYNK